jgi:sodium/potassium-transporting ATPase subunit alpha
MSDKAKSPTNEPFDGDEDSPQKQSPKRSSSFLRRRDSTAVPVDEDGSSQPRRTRSFMQRMGAAPLDVVPAERSGYNTGDMPVRSPTGAIRNHSGLKKRSIVVKRDADGEKTGVAGADAVEAEVQWHALPLEQIYEDLNTSAAGLTDDGAAAAVEKYGKNMITPPKTLHWFVKFLLTLLGGFQLMMFVGAILSFIVFGIDPSDVQTLALAIMLLTVVFATSAVQTFQEGKSDDTMEALRAMSADTVYVYRNGVTTTKPADEVVPGDIVIVKGGEKVPADMRIITASDLKVNNAPLTGENVDIKLGADPLHEQLYEAKNIARSGCNFTNGTGMGVVFATGDKTFFGQIASSTTQIDRPDTLMKREIHRLILYMGVFAGVLGVTFFILSVVVGYSIIQGIVFAISIIVANVPEGLLPQLTVALTLTAKRMQGRGVLVSNLEIIETLGAVTVICSDKTGTLTCNRMTVSHVCYNGEVFNTSNAPPPLPEDTFKDMDKDNKDFQNLQRIVTLNSDAQFLMNEVSEADKDDVLKWTAKGDATEIGLIKFCEPFRCVEEYRATSAKVGVIPFNSTNKWMMSICEDEHDATNAPVRLMVKGAPEKVLNMCGNAYKDGAVVPMDEAVRQHFDDINFTLGSRGERVIGFAQLELDRATYPPGFVFDVDSDVPNFPMSNLTFVGYVSLIDPPRDMVKPAIVECNRAGVQVFMVTGDHPVTALAIARSVGLVTMKTADELRKEGQEVPGDYRDVCVIHGTDDLAKFTQQDWDFTLEHKEIVFARTMPQQKQDIVTQLNRKGQIVAMTGDGVNDAPALKAANVGVAMGSGTSVAKEAAQVIVLDDDFSSIVDGIREGRLIFENLKKCIAYVLSSNVPEIIPFLLLIAFGFPLTIETIVILCIDLGTDILPAIALAYEEAEDAIMDKKPRTANDHLVGPQLMGVAYGTIGMFQTFGAFFAFIYVFEDYGFKMSTMWYNGVGYRNKIEDLTASQKNSFYNFCSENPQVSGKYGLGFSDEECRSFRISVLQQAQACYFMAVVYSQYANVLIRKTQIATIFTKERLLGNTFLNVSFLTEFVIFMSITHIPGLNTAFGFEMPSSKHATTSLWIIPFIIIWDEIRKFICRSNPDGFINKYTNF